MPKSMDRGHASGAAWRTSSESTVTATTSRCCDRRSRIVRERFDVAGLQLPARGRELHLLVRRPDGVTLSYDWSFRDGPVEVSHHGWTRGDSESGVLAVPGEAPRVASSQSLH